MRSALGPRYARTIFGPEAPRRGGYFLLLAQKKCNQRRWHPVHRSPCWGLPCVARQAGRLRNSRDPLRGHALRQCSPTAPDLPALLGDSQGPQLRRIGYNMAMTFQSRGIRNA